MATEAQVKAFLSDFHQKMKIYPEEIRFRDDRGKNFEALAVLDITARQRLEYIKALTLTDYSEGPKDDILHTGSPLWVFGCMVKKVSVYIKISMGPPNKPVICISFHPAEYEMAFPFKRSEDYE